MKNDAKKGAKSQQKPSKNEVWKMIDFWIDFSEVRVDLFVFLRTLFHPNLPSVRKVTCRKTNKKGKENKKKERLQCRTRQSVRSTQTRPAGPRSRPGADLSCLRQYIRPGPAEKGFCENLRLVGAHAAIRDFLQFGCSKISKMTPGDPKSEKIVARMTKVTPRAPKVSQRPPKVS